MAPAAVIEINRAVIVLEQMGIDGLRAVNEPIHQRFAGVIDKRACGIVGHSDLQTTDLVIALDVVAGEDQVVFTALFDDGGRPHSLMDIGIAGHIDDIFVLFPVHQIGGGKGVQIHLILVGGEGLGDVNPIAALVETGFRIGIPAVDDGIHRGSSFADVWAGEWIV